MGFHRAPRTTQERRANGRRDILRIDGYEIRLRGKRSMPILPDTYDDLMRSDWHHHSWKRHRLTQYKGGIDMTAVVDFDKCKGHAECEAACPTNAIEMVSGEPNVNSDACADCGACVEACPEQAITIE